MKQPCKVIITMEDEPKGHHIHIDVSAKDEEEVEHMFTHLLLEYKTNKLGKILRNLMLKGLPITEEEMKLFLGDEQVEEIKQQAQEHIEQIKKRKATLN